MLIVMLVGACIGFLCDGVGGAVWGAIIAFIVGFICAVAGGTK